MKRIRLPYVLAALIPLLAACGAARAPQGASGPDAFKARARADSLRYPYTQADIDFMSGMIHHHAQALVMSRMAPTHGASAAIIRLTERIINAQNDDIRLMSNWLRDRNQPVPDPNPTGMPMEHGGMAHTMLMPGMLTAEQMQQLDAARGEEFDRLFLSGMIEHHRGAVVMVKELFSAQGAGQDETMFKFAADVEVDQSTEIKRMVTMMLEMGATDPGNINCQATRFRHRTAHLKQRPLCHFLCGHFMAADCVECGPRTGSAPRILVRALGLSKTTCLGFSRSHTGSLGIGLSYYPIDHCHWIGRALWQRLVKW